MTNSGTTTENLIYKAEEVNLNALGGTVIRKIWHGVQNQNLIGSTSNRTTAFIKNHIPTKASIVKLSVWLIVDPALNKVREKAFDLLALEAMDAYRHLELIMHQKIL